MHKYMINNMEDKRLPKVSLKSNQDGWCKDPTTWLNNWEIEENDTLQDINKIKNIITSKFKRKS